MNNNQKFYYYYPARSNVKYYVSFCKMLYHFLNMKKDDVVVIMSPNGNAKMNRKELAKYLWCLWRIL